MKQITKVVSIFSYLVKSFWLYWKEDRTRKSYFKLKLSNPGFQDYKKIEIYSSINQIKRLVSEQDVHLSIKNFSFYCFHIFTDLIKITSFPLEKKIIAGYLPLNLWIKIMWNIDNPEHKEIYKEFFDLTASKKIILLPSFW